MRMRALSALGVVALMGCQSPPEPVVTPEPLNIRTAPDFSESAPVYTSRYVRENRAPSSELTDILGIPVEVRIPVMSQMSLSDGMKFMLQGSGVTLRKPTSYAEAQMYQQALPLSQTAMGNMSLREALQVMGGQAFVLEEDVVVREVGFRLKEGYVWEPAATPVLTRTQVNSAPQTSKPSFQSTVDNRSTATLPKPQTETVTLSPTIARKLAANNRSAELSQSNDELFSGGKGSKEITTDKVRTSKPSSVKSNITTFTFRVNTGESYREALTRWAHKSGHTRIAFAQEPDFLSSLDAIAERSFVVNDTLPRAISKLSREYEALNSLGLHARSSLNLVALHPWGRQSVTAFMAQGENLKEAVQGVVTHYQWQWDEKRSWSVVDNPPFTDYPIVTREGDISAAMRVMLAAYPLKAQRLDAMKTIYIQEAAAL